LKLPLTRRRSQHMRLARQMRSPKDRDCKCKNILQKMLLQPEFVFEYCIFQQWNVLTVCTLVRKTEWCLSCIIIYRNIITFWLANYVEQNSWEANSHWASSAVFLLNKFLQLLVSSSLLSPNIILNTTAHGRVVTLLLHIWKVPDSNLSLETSYPEVSWFSLVPPGECQDNNLKLGHFLLNPFYFVICILLYHSML
jgi:hypothetical protein